MHNNMLGPSLTGPGSQMIGIIDDKHGHKENQSCKHVLGASHHKEYLQCFTCHLAMSLFMRLHSDAHLNFFQSHYTRGDAMLVESSSYLRDTRPRSCWHFIS